MGKKAAKKSTEDEIFALVSEHLGRLPAAPEHAADGVGIGPNGITYTFKVKLNPEEEIVDFADELRDKIRQSGIPQLQLAKAAGISQPSLYHFMNETQDIRLQTFNRLAKLMGFELKHQKSKMPKKNLPKTKAPKANG